jgi:hypothetical protein
VPSPLAPERPGGVADDRLTGIDVSCDHGACADDRPMTDPDTSEDHGTRSEGSAALDDRLRRSQSPLTRGLSLMKRAP